jgi:protein-tyrosine phosphatase
VFQVTEISPGSTSYLMSNLSAGKEYNVKLAAKNLIGLGDFFIFNTTVRTLDTDPEFVPEISIKGITKNSIFVGWNDPPEAVAPYIHFYKVTKRAEDHTAEVIHNQPSSIHLWDGLAPATRYLFTVAACNRYSGECSASSPVMAGSTYDGVAGPPADVSLSCRSDNVSAMNWVDVKWQPPVAPNGRLEFYNVELTGRAKFTDENGKTKVIDTASQSKTEDAVAAAAVMTGLTMTNNSSHTHAPLTKSSLMTRFDFLESNTNYSVRVCAVTGSKECGEWRSAACTMGPRPPSEAELAKFSWTPAVAEETAKSAEIPGGRSGPLFKLSIPRLSGRNGAICCLRVVVVKLPTDGAASSSSSQAPPLPGDVVITSYAAVHASPGTGSGAYIAEIVSAIYMGREVVIGDGKNTAALGLGTCHECSPPLVALAAREKIQKRFTGGDVSGGAGGNLHLHHHEALADAKSVEDGFLDAAANYTAFVEVIVEGGHSSGGGGSLIGRSPYMVARKGTTVIDSRKLEVNTVLVSVLGVLAGLVLVALILLAFLFTLRRYSKQVASQQGVEMMDLKHTFRHFCSTLRRGGGSAGGHAAQFLLTQDNFTTAPDLPPIEKAAMVAAYLERHKDSDYGFQAEFESLPESCSDRTTTACDLACNRPKNRYPDIKSYDQTRVRLAPVEGVEGSDYINANFVVGYKERKRWICAQGPLVATLEDFWRMIQEQGVELIIMLTNLEEYNRIKCAQYWPGAGQSTFGQIRVGFVQEHRYSDFVVRELKVTQGEGGKSRQIFHYHYLQWKEGVNKLRYVFLR